VGKDWRSLGSDIPHHFCVYSRVAVAPIVELQREVLA